MSKGRFTSRRTRLNRENYLTLKREIIERDRWRCQFCGSTENLQVHHLTFRSHMGSDSEQNLITLCAICHSIQHGMKGI
jgi:5-methylcytosine-specific restriction endonuclease McrA